MKFSFKIFTISFFLVISLLGIGGFLIINSNFNNELLIKKDSTLNSNKMLTMIYYSISLNDMNEDIYEFNITEYILKQFQNISNNGEVFIGEESNLKYIDNSSFINELNYNEQGSCILKKDAQYFFQVVTKLNINDEDVYIENLVDITNIYELRSQNYKLYCLFLIIGSLISSSIIAFFSIYITSPLKKLQQTTNQIARGNFDIRNNNSLKTMKSPELVALATDFNNMTDKIEEYIRELQDYNQRQEDFISRFTHELKTPLTSIIGYADILRTYDIEPKKRYELANYIFKEGKRLEDLSFHLLNLIILKQDEFPFKEYNSKQLFKELTQTLAILLKKYNIKLEFNIEEVTIFIEPVLLKSLLYNLVDNACKASEANNKLIISGIKNDNLYTISVQDFGKGIDDEHLKKVTEPFYMVDKSRARKQGGAGLGLALCKEIAALHKSELLITSKLGVGTKISFSVEVVNGK